MVIIISLMASPSVASLAYCIAGGVGVSCRRGRLNPHNIVAVGQKNYCHSSKLLNLLISSGNNTVQGPIKFLCWNSRVDYIYGNQSMKITSVIRNPPALNAIRKEYYASLDRGVLSLIWIQEWDLWKQRVETGVGIVSRNWCAKYPYVQ